jgi:hypothetical protein
MSDGFRALVCLTTCDRAPLLKRYAPHYVAFCRSDRAFDFVVSLDGGDGASRATCESLGLPLVYSDEREGVGLAKNRIVRQFGGYDYYFFIEDDVELLQSQVFREHIRLAELMGLHHLSLFERGGARWIVRVEERGGHRIVHARYGGGQFNFFTRQGLDAVGGWHTSFAAFRRFGHTEHSYRFVHRGLAEAAFVVAETLSGCLLWHYPPAVTRSAEVPSVSAETQLCPHEEALIRERLKFFPVQTLCPYTTNDKPLDCSSAPWADRVVRDRYPLLTGRERRQAWADFHVARSNAQGGWRRWWSLLRAALAEPRNTHLRYVLKAELLQRKT